MTLESWTLSARLAWSRIWIRAAVIAVLLVSCGMSLFFLTKVLPAAQSQGTVILHYNLYLGIDEVRSWPWALALPAVWIGTTLIDVVIAFGVYRTDPNVSVSLISLALLWSLPWSAALFYLMLINL